MISIHGKPTVAPLRYNLAGYRPSKTVRQTGSSSESPSELSKVLLHFKGRCYIIALRLPPTLDIKMHKTQSTYSKAPRGLFVLVDVGRVFTAIAISPSNRLRQLLVRDTIRAGRNLPDKELRLKTSSQLFWDYG